MSLRQRQDLQRCSTFVGLRKRVATSMAGSTLVASEAINSMYNYYRNAGECFIYLSDVPAPAGDITDQGQQSRDSFKTSSWFSRGWTLQELLAPKARVFFAEDWSEIEDKGQLVDMVAAITNIDVRLLKNRELMSTFCIAERISWGSKRRTTRNEDVAYSLMGLFNIHMAIIYGEGGVHAFRRLQEEIIRTSFDQSIFVWKGAYESSGLLAKSPADFRATPRLGLWGTVNLAPFTMTNVGLSVRINVAKITAKDREWLPDGLEDITRVAVVQCDVWDGEAWLLLVLFLKPVSGANFYANGRLCKAYRRVECHSWIGVPVDLLDGRTGPSRCEDALILEDEHFALVNRAIADHVARMEGSSLGL